MYQPPWPIIGGMLMEEITREDVKDRVLAKIVWPMKDEDASPRRSA
jgi:hypothetical protein